MSWALKHIADLKAGMSVVAKPAGRSMEPLIYSKDEVFILPAKETTIVVGDIVLCRVGGNDLLHKITAIQGDRYQISNNKGYVNGWTKAVYGYVLCVIHGKGTYVRKD
jgi:signal peptidase I